MITDTDDTKVINFVSSPEQKDVIDLSQVLPAGANGANIANYISVSISGVTLDTLGVGNFFGQDPLLCTGQNM